jgi:hypothetical protein
MTMNKLHCEIPSGGGQDSYYNEKLWNGAKPHGGSSGKGITKNTTDHLFTADDLAYMKELVIAGESDRDVAAEFGIGVATISGRTSRIREQNKC